MLTNPWARGTWREYGNWTRRLWGHKVLELQITRYSSEVLGFLLDTTWRGRDHAGFELELNIFSYNFALRCYDSRHWDYASNKWSQYNEEDICQNNQNQQTPQ